MELNGQAGWACRDKAPCRSSLLMLTKLFYTAFSMHATHAMRWFLYLDVKQETEGEKEREVAVWTPKRTNRCRDGKDKAPKASSNLSLRHLATQTMSIFLLVHHGKLDLPILPSLCLPHFTLISKFSISHPTAVELCYLSSFPCPKDKSRGTTSLRTIELAQTSPESNSHFWPSQRQGLSLKLSSIFLHLCAEKCFRRNSRASFSILPGAVVFNP